MSTTAATQTAASTDTFLAEVEQRMVELLAHYEGPAADAARDSIAAGGKRLRPLLVFAGTPSDAAVLPPVRRAIVSSAAAVELMHTATLVHDDVLDGAGVRRGRATTVHAHGGRVATATGDLLFSLAFRALTDHAAEPTTRRAIALLARTARTLAEGEALQADQAHDPMIAIEDYLRRCEQKTGVLFGVALALGATYGNATPDDVTVLERFGIDVGLAFQLTDDLLDCTGSVDELGKEPGADVRDGTITLPLLVAARDDEQLARALRTPDTDISDVLTRVNASDGPSTTRRRALDVTSAAVASLDLLGAGYDSDARTRLAEIAHYAVKRLH